LPDGSHAPLTRSEFERYVRRALIDLHDPVALRRNPLNSLIAPEPLRDYLVRVIDALQPASKAHPDGKAWRPYRVLQLRYVRGHAAADVEHMLAVSTSQYYREHQAALGTITSLIFDELSHASATAPSRLHNLPAQITSFVGREKELARVDALLRETRLLTLTGAGGCGKTRLALEAAARQVDHFSDGVWLVDLTSLAEPHLVAQTVAFALGIRPGSGEPMTGLVEALRNRTTLLVLDNCEHLLEACVQFIDVLLRACAGVSILVTSRELIGITGETVFQIPPLEFPDRLESDLLRFPAVKLFLDRASAASPDFRLTDDNAGSVMQICRRLDGLPLAIELAAARMNVFSAQQIADRLNDRFRLLTSGSRSAPQHHQTLHALIDWSYELLNADERKLFGRLSVFVGGWRLEAAEVVCSAGGLASADIGNLLAGLVERSLVLADPAGGAMRYRMLETLREYASQRLSGDPDAALVQQRHGRYYASVAEHVEGMIFGPAQLAALEQLEIEHNNMRAVLSNATVDDEAGRLAAHVAASLGLFWFIGNYFSEARHWCNLVLSLESVEDDPAVTRCLAFEGFFAASLGEHAEGVRRCDRAVAQAEQRGDALSRAWAMAVRCGTNFVTGDAAATERDARVGIERCLEAGWPWGAAACSAWLGRSLLMQRNVDEAAEQLRRALDLARSVGDPLSIGLALSFYGSTLGVQGDYDAAARALREALDLFRSIRCYAQISRCLVDWGLLAARNRKVDDAAAALAEGLQIASQLGRVPYRIAQLLSGTAQVAAATGRWTEAAEFLLWTGQIRARSGAHVPAELAAEEIELQLAIEREIGSSTYAQLQRMASMADETAAMDAALHLLESALAH
jgi:predicted ATPase/Tfp pilus assembly protein PilF